MRLTVKNIARIVLLTLIVATLAFIFVQSVLPPEKSSEQSDKVSDIVEEIIPPETPVGDYVQTNVRKIAHFVEFAALGVWVALYIVGFYRRRTVALASYAAALIVALFDETIQIFSGRGPEIKDVWIDFLGYLTSFTLVIIASFVVMLVIKKIKSKTA